MASNQQRFEIDPSLLSRLWVDLRIIVNNGSCPAEITQDLEIVPDFLYSAGDKFRLAGGKGEHFRTGTIWGLESCEINSDKLDDHLSYVVSRLKGVEGRMQKYVNSEEYEVIIRSHLCRDSGLDGFIISSNMIAQLKGIYQILIFVVRW